MTEVLTDKMRQILSDHQVELLFLCIYLFMYFSIPNFYLNYNESGLWHNATLKIRTTSNKWVLCHIHIYKK